MMMMMKYKYPVPLKSLNNKKEKFIMTFLGTQSQSQSQMNVIDDDNENEYVNTCNTGMEPDYALPFYTDLTMEREITSPSSNLSEVLKLSDKIKNDCIIKLTRYLLYVSNKNQMVKFSDLKKIFPKYRNVARYRIFSRYKKESYVYKI